jgi:hypothetical protein
MDVVMQLDDMAIKERFEMARDKSTVESIARRTVKAKASALASSDEVARA